MWLEREVGWPHVVIWHCGNASNLAVMGLGGGVTAAFASLDRSNSLILILSLVYRQPHFATERKLLSAVTSRSQLSSVQLKSITKSLASTWSRFNVQRSARSATT